MSTSAELKTKITSGPLTSEAIPIHIDHMLSQHIGHIGSYTFTHDDILSFTHEE